MVCFPLCLAILPTMTYDELLDAWGSMSPVCEGISMDAGADYETILKPVLHILELDDPHSRYATIAHRWCQMTPVTDEQVSQARIAYPLSVSELPIRQLFCRGLLYNFLRNPTMPPAVRTILEKKLGKKVQSFRATDIRLAAGKEVNRDDFNMASSRDSAAN